MKQLGLLLSESGRFLKIMVAVPTLIVGMSLTAVALPLSDDFSSGNDAAWTRFEPLVGFGSGGTYSFPSGGYRIQAVAPSPNPVALGATRVGSLRNDESIIDAVISWDVVDWNDSLDQVFGGLGRVTDVGIGTTDGYGLVYGNGELNILRFDDEVPAGLASPVAIVLDPSNDYRFVLTLDGDSLMGQVYDLAAPGVVIASLSGTDATYASGVTGFVVANTSPLGDGTADATFDNFNVVPEPTALALAVLGLLGLGCRTRRR